QPDDENAHHFQPTDIWFWLAGNWTEPKSKLKFSGLARVVVPASYESVYANLVLGLAGGLGVSRKFEWGKDKHWNASVSLSSAATKNFHTHTYRGSGFDDLSGCRGMHTPASLGTAARSVDGPAVSPGDACGGPLNTNVSVVSSLSLGVGWKK